MDNNLFQIRVTGILVNCGKVLLVKQNVSSDRVWSLPGGRLEAGESLEQGIVREMAEETGLQTRALRLLYLCDKIDSIPPMLHITFLMERVSGELTLPTNEFDENPIHDVRMIPI
jgi:ADP-ribose pyrophosphatase YjhB (NUDIX family)